MNPTVNIRFGKSSSFLFERAIHLAADLPGYGTEGEGRNVRYHIALKAGLDNPVWEKAERLLRLIAGWRSACITIDGKAIRPWRLLRSLTLIKACYAEKLKHGLSDRYCSGKNTQNSEAAYFGCRLCRGVSRSQPSYSHRNELWTEFGTLSAQHDAFHVDKKAIFKTLEQSSKDDACFLCPAFRWQRVRMDVDDLPDTIALHDDSPYEVRYSQLHPGKALGIQRKKEDTPMQGALFTRLEVKLPSAAKTAVGQRHVPNVRYGDVAGQDKALAALQQIVQLPLTHADYFAAVKVEPQTGVLLYGPPGTGKTLLAKAAATECQAHLEIINGPEILSKWVGESEANLRRMFGRCRALAPSILLIDEIDSLAPSRAWVSQQHHIQLISQLLVLLDGLEARGRVAVVATTNRLEAVDAALRRPGRFDYHIEVPLPDRKGRAAILKVHLKKMRVSKGLRLHGLVKATEGFSGAELAGLCREAGLQAIVRALAVGIAASDVRVTEEDLSAALATWRAKRS